MDILDKAIIYATEKHSGSHRKSTTIPYIVHPLEALTIAATMTDDKEVLAAAVLHDTVEDTDASSEDIEALFGKRVRDLVGSNSENKRENRPAADTWRIRKQETLDHIMTSSFDEQILVLADKLSNLRAICRDYKALGEPFWNRFNVKDKSEHGWYYCGVRDRLTLVTDTAAFAEYRDLTVSVFGM